MDLTDAGKTLIPALDVLAAFADSPACELVLFVINHSQDLLILLFSEWYTSHLTELIHLHIRTSLNSCIMRLKTLPCMLIT